MYYGRESDYVEPKHHESYTAKPTVVLQLSSQAARFSGPSIAGVNCSTVNDIQAPVVPATYDTVYDPRDPRADWGGLMTKENNKKHTNGTHRSQQLGIEQTELGIISKEEKQEWSRLRRNPDTVPKNDNIIGGIASDGDRWQTNYQALTHGDGTRKDQLTLQKRTAPRVPLPNPAQASQRGAVGNHLRSQQSTPRGAAGSEGGDYSPRSEQGSVQGGGSLIGYRAPPATKSLFSNMGAELVEAAVVPANAPAPFVPSVSPTPPVPFFLLLL